MNQIIWLRWTDSDSTLSAPLRLSLLVYPLKTWLYYFPLCLSVVFFRHLRDEIFPDGGRFARYKPQRWACLFMLYACASHQEFLSVIQCLWHVYKHSWALTGVSFRVCMCIVVEMKCPHKDRNIWSFWPCWENWRKEKLLLYKNCTKKEKKLKENRAWH